MQRNRQFCCVILLDISEDLLLIITVITNFNLNDVGHSLEADTKRNPIDDFVAPSRSEKVSAFEGWNGWQVHDEAGRRKYLSGAERARFLSAADCLAPPMLALCHVLAYAGCRISEALALTFDHVDAERLALTIRTLKRRRVVFRDRKSVV